MRLAVFTIGLIVFILFLLATVGELYTNCTTSPRASYLTGLPYCSSAAALVVGFVIITIIGFAVMIGGIVMKEHDAVVYPPLPQPEQQPVQQIPAQVACKNCGRVYTMGQYKYCPNCGGQLQ